MSEYMNVKVIANVWVQPREATCIPMPSHVPAIVAALKAIRQSERDELFGNGDEVRYERANTWFGNLVVAKADHGEWEFHYCEDCTEGCCFDQYRVAGFKDRTKAVAAAVRWLHENGNRWGVVTPNKTSC